LSKQELEKELEEPVELDENELEKYIEFVVKEVRKKDRSTLNNQSHVTVYRNLHCIF
jgi:hypothetical protein